MQVSFCLQLNLTFELSPLHQPRASIIGLFSQAVQTLMLTMPLTLTVDMHEL